MDTRTLIAFVAFAGVFLVAIQFVSAAEAVLIGLLAALMIRLGK